MHYALTGRTLRTILLGAAALSGLAVSKPALAAATNGQQQAAVTEEIIVTARRRKEAIQDVPIAITAFGTDTIREQHITSNQDLMGKVPSLIVGSNGQTRASETFTLRGQGATFFASQGVVMYIAEAPAITGLYASTQGGPGAMLDLENLQVLKGPQGTLFGRNTTGGAVLLEPARPTDTLSGYVQGQIGNYADHELEGVINVPVVPDKLLTRVAARIVDRNGFTTNTASNKKLDDKRYWTGRIGITFRPTDTIENYLMAYNTTENDHGTGLVGLAVNSGRANDGTGIGNNLIYGIAGGLLKGDPNVSNPNPAVAFPAILSHLGPDACFAFDTLNSTSGCGQSLVTDQQQRGARTVNAPVQPFNKLRTYGATDIFKFDLTDTLTFRNIASYAVLRQGYSWEEDGFPVHFIDQLNARNQYSSNVRQWTEEAQLQGKLLEGNLQYTVGGYHEVYEPDGPMSNSAVVFPAANANALFGPALGSLLAPNGAFAASTLSYGITRRSTAGYAQGVYDLGQISPTLDGVKFTGGFRYTWDTTGGFSDGVISVPILGVTSCNDALPSYPGACRRDAVEHSSAANWLVGLDYKVTPESLVYFHVSRGYKAGGFNAYSVNAFTKTFKPEYNRTYELGTKTDFDVAGVPARVNLAAYRSDYTNIQRAAGDTNSANGTGAATFNAAGATIQGVELEAVVRPFKGFDLSGSYTFTDASYNNYTVTASAAQIDCTGGLIPAGGQVNLTCLPFQYVAKHMWSIQAHYELPLPEAVGQVVVGGAYQHWSPQYSAPTSVPSQEPYAWLDAAGVANFTIDWKNVAKAAPIDIQLFMTNAFDKTYRISNSNVFASGLNAAAIYGAPRMFGAQIKYRFGEGR